MNLFLIYIILFIVLSNVIFIQAQFEPAVGARFDINPNPSNYTEVLAELLDVKKAINIPTGRKIELTASHIQNIVDKHNERRSIVIPTAKAMRFMTWDEDLAKLALSYSKKCIYEHNPDRKTKRFKQAGENIAISTGYLFTERYGSNAVGAWDNEKSDYTYSTRKCVEGRMCGHYTQVVWEETFKVGCAVVTCEKVNVRGKWWKDATMFLCNYGPAGNYDRHPYFEGTPCSNCHSSDTCENKLCKNPLRDSSMLPTPRWSEWTEFDSCSKTCKGGIKSRERSCNTFYDGDCDGYSKELMFCNSFTPCSPITISYQPWSQWSECSHKCDVGVQKRTKRCGTNSIPCTDVSETRKCTCADWNKWTPYGPCTKTCGGGTTTKTRTCKMPGKCKGKSEITEVCNTAACLPAVTLLPWSNWSHCDITCGSGIHTRTRSCSIATVTRCGGKLIETKPCTRSKCTVPSWSSWSLWSDCTKTCDKGTQQRTRSCIAGQNGDTECSGSKQQTVSCSENSCPELGPWSNWESCSVSCGSGIETRERNCVRGEIHDCTPVKDYRDCDKPPCVTLEETNHRDINNKTNTGAGGSAKLSYFNLYNIIMALLFSMIPYL